MGRITSFIKQVIKFLICFSLIYTPTLLFAAAAEKWTIEKVVYDNVGKNLSYTASRVNALASNDLVYKAKVPVTASAAGSTALSMIRMGVAGAALYGLVEAVGWIIDNGVVKKLGEQNSDNNNAFEYLWVVINANQSSPDPKCRSAGRYSTTTKAISHITSCNLLRGVKDTSCAMTSINSINCVGKFPEGYTSSAGQILREKNNNYDPSIQPSYVPVSPSEMGNKIIDSPAAPQILPDIYNPNNPVSRPSPAPDSVQRSLDNASPIPRVIPKGDTTPKPNTDTDGDGVPDAYDPLKPSVGEEFTLPEFCSWAVTVCEWYTKYKEDSDLVKQHRESEKDIWLKEDVAREEEKTAREEEKEQRKDEKTFWQKVEDWFDWTKDDLPEYPDSQLDIEIPQQEIDTEINFGGACPAPLSSDINFMGLNKTIEFSFDPVCQIAEFIKPVVISISAFSAALIVAGVRTEDD